MEKVGLDYKYTLIRKRDGLVKQSQDVTWIEWFEDGTVKERHNTPEAGRSLILAPFSSFYTWLTTPITEILEKSEEYVKFKTQNSTYILEIIQESTEK